METKTVQDQLVLTRTFVYKGVCPRCGKIFYDVNDTEVLASLGGHMTASHKDGKNRTD